MTFSHWCWQLRGWWSAGSKKINILNAVVTLIASYYLFNADYPKGLGGHSKNVYLFLEYILIPELRSNRSLPISVETAIGKLNKMV